MAFSKPGVFKSVAQLDTQSRLFVRLTGRTAEEPGLTHSILVDEFCKQASYSPKQQCYQFFINVPRAVFSAAKKLVILRI